MWTMIHFYGASSQSPTKILEQAAKAKDALIELAPTDIAMLASGVTPRKVAATPRKNTSQAGSAANRRASQATTASPLTRRTLQSTPAKKPATPPPRKSRAQSRAQVSAKVATRSVANAVAQKREAAGANPPATRRGAAKKEVVEKAPATSTTRKTRGAPTKVAEKAPAAASKKKVPSTPKQNPGMLSSPERSLFPN